jgi:ribonuclease R
LVHISNLGQDYYHFDPTSHQLKGERTGDKYRIGDKVLVKVARVSLDDKKIDFELVLKTRNPKSSVSSPSDKPAKKRRKKVKAIK